jgi:hypothetical protein
VKRGRRGREAGTDSAEVAGKGAGHIKARLRPRSGRGRWRHIIDGGRGFVSGGEEGGRASARLGQPGPG